MDVPENHECDQASAGRKLRPGRWNKTALDFAVAAAVVVFTRTMLATTYRSERVSVGGYQLRSLLMITFVIGVVMAAIVVLATRLMTDMASMLERFMLVQAVLVQAVLVRFVL